MPVIHVSSHAEFTKHISGSKPVVVDFHATWCGPCKAVAPRFEKLSDEVNGMTFLKVDVDEHQSISKECGVRAMPTFQIYRSGSKLAEVVGADIAKVERLVRQHASSSAGGGFPATGGRVLGSGAPAPRAGAGGDWGGGYVWYVAAAALLAYLWWTKNDPSMTGEPRRV